MKLTPRQSNPDTEQGSTREKKKLSWSQLESPLIISFGLVFGIVISLVVGIYIYQTEVVAKKTKQLELTAEQYAQSLALELSRYIAGEQEKISFFASQSLLVGAVRDNNEKMLREMERSLKRQVKDVRSVSFLPRGTAQLDADRKPPIRFSELSLIKAAEQGEKPSPEAVHINGEWLIHFFNPIQQPGESETLPVGVLWLTTSLNDLKNHLTELSSSSGSIRVFQNFDNRGGRLVFQAGSPGTNFTALMKANNSHWELEFTLSQERERALVVDSSMAIILSVLIAVFVCGCTSFISYKVAMTRKEARDRKQLEQEMYAAGSAEADVTPGFASVSIADEDESLLGLENDDSGSDSEQTDTISLDDDVFEINGEADINPEEKYPSEIFRAYDIRGIVEEQITKEFATSLGRALGTELIEQNQNTIVVARDARKHSPQLTEYLLRGILSTGCNVLNIGTVPTPLMYFAVATMDEVSSGVVVTASHNGPAWNGFKMILDGKSRSEEDIQSLRKRMINADYRDGLGQENHHDIVSGYIDTIFSDVALAGDLHVVVDAANGVAGKVAPRLFEELGCQVEALYCDLDGSFPNHNPDPSVESNLDDLIRKVKDVEADIGLAFDGDGDRLVAVSATGKIFTADRLLMLFATDIISRSPGSDVIFDVKSTRHLNSCITNAGGRPVMWKTGHSKMRQKMQETGAVVGAEYSGHIFIRDRWFGFDDGLYAAARLLEVLTLQDEGLDDAFAAFPVSISTPEYRVAVDESEKFELIEKLKSQADFGEGKLTTIDGVRVDFGYGWGLVRASNTGPELTLRFEADTEDNIHQLKALFVKELKKIDSHIEVNWNQDAG